VATELRPATMAAAVVVDQQEQGEMHLLRRAVLVVTG